MQRPLVMGIVNVTPDSFSDGGRWFAQEAAVARAEQLVAQGADIVDVGGESTRPGAERPDAREEARRVVPVVQALAQQGVRVSVDTMRASVAEEALAAGAQIINDVSGGLADERMGQVVAEADALFIAMHWRGHSAGMQRGELTQYTDLLGDICRELRASVATLRAAGVREENIVVDPGFGFSKTAAQNWELLARMGEFDVDGLPVLWGTSRKSFLGQAGLPAGSAASTVPAAERDAATAATSVIAVQHGAWGVRVHDVLSTLAAVDVALRAGGEGVLIP